MIRRLFASAIFFVALGLSGPILAASTQAQPVPVITVALTGEVRLISERGPEPWTADATVILTPAPSPTLTTQAGQGVLAVTSVDASGHYAIYAPSVPPGAYVLTATLEQSGAQRAVAISISPSDDGRTIDTTIDVSPPPASRGTPTDTFLRIPVFFATDRKAGIADDLGAAFLDEPSAPRTMSYGRAIVTIPRQHQRGQLEGSDDRVLRDDKANHIMLERVDLYASAGQLFTEVGSNLDASKTRNPLRRIVVFVHGYRTSFNHALRVGAQIKYDLEPIETTMIVFSWPSENTILGYFRDQAQSDASVSNFKLFLLGLAQQNPQAHISVLAHSLGNSVVMQALEQIARDGGVHAPVFDHVVMAAPDIPAADLTTNSCAIGSLSRDITMYSSNHDQALLAATFVSAGQDLLAIRREDPRRAGFAIPPIVALGVDTIDASSAATDLIGHGYFSSDVDILSDIQGILNERQLPRPHLFPEIQYWMFAPQPVGGPGPQRVDPARCPRQ